MTDKYAEEAKRIYEQTEAYQESARKTAGYSDSDWERILAESERIYRDLARRMDKGPHDALVQEGIAAWRQHITDNYYNCTLDIFRGLGDMYVEDELFTASIDYYGKGLAAFMREAMKVYCDGREA